MSKKEITPEKRVLITSKISEFIFQHGLENGDNVIDRDEANLDSKFLVAELVDIILETEPN